MLIVLLLFLASSCYVYAQRERLYNYSNIWIGLFLLYLRSFFEISLWIYHFLVEDSNSQSSSYRATRDDYSFLLKSGIVPVLQKEIQSINNLGDDIREWHPSQKYNVLTFKRQIAPSDQDLLTQELISNKDYIISRLNDSFFELKDLDETSFSFNVKRLELINGNLTLILDMSWGE